MSTTSSSTDGLTPTSYAMLGLLAVQPWTTYELAKQMQRSVSWFWPRAERKHYDEAKRLAARGLASVRPVMTGRRPGKVYEITADGRAALRRWLASPPGAPPQIEVEAMIRVFFADSGTPAQLLNAIRSVGDDADAALARLGDMAAESAAGEDRFPDRRATNALAMELFVRLHETMADWSRWAGAEAESWPSAQRGRRTVPAGTPQRGSELFAVIAARLGRRS